MSKIERDALDRMSDNAGMYNFISSDHKILLNLIEAMDILRNAMKTDKLCIRWKEGKMVIEVPDIVIDKMWKYDKLREVLSYEE